MGRTTVDPRWVIERIKANSGDRIKWLGRGAFGEAGLIRDSSPPRVIKLTTDPAEVAIRYIQIDKYGHGVTPRAHSEVYLVAPLAAVGTNPIKLLWLVEAEYIPHAGDSIADLIAEKIEIPEGEREWIVSALNQLLYHLFDSLHKSLSVKTLELEELYKTIEFPTEIGGFGAEWRVINNSDIFSDILEQLYKETLKEFRHHMRYSKDKSPRVAKAIINTISPVIVRFIYELFQDFKDYEFISGDHRLDNVGAQPLGTRSVKLKVIDPGYWVVILNSKQLEWLRETMTHELRLRQSIIQIEYDHRNVASKVYIKPQLEGHHGHMETLYQRNPGYRDALVKN